MTAETARLERNIRWVWGAVVATVMATYYWVFFFPPRLVGGNDPDRFYHLGVSRIISEHGFPRTLPQAADLGWANYFPEKEFLFHALTGAADLVAGTTGVLLLVPALGIGILCVLYKTLSHVIRPWQAATIALAVPLVTTAMLFRITLLRPHLLAILFFTLLLFAILRGRPWLAALASAGFALSYHAFYIIILTIGIAAVFRWSDKPGGARRWQWALAGLAFGMVINPYFPSNVVMSWTHVQIALGLDAPPGAEFGAEIQPVSVAAYLLAFGFMPVLLLAVAATRKFRSTADITPGKNAIYFLFLLSLALTVLSAQTVRAAEYAVPAVILLFGYGLQLASSKWWLPGMLAALALAQGASARYYYSDVWSQSQAGSERWYFDAIAAIPARAGSAKVFNCQWDAGAYLLFLRPELRFVDLLDPSFLWQVAPKKYLARQQLLRGGYADPHMVLEDVFAADYVLCASPLLIEQMATDPSRFRPLPVHGTQGPLKLFEMIASPGQSAIKTQ